MANGEETIREDVKVLLGIQDPIQDPVLDILIRNTKKHLKILLVQINPEIKTIPEDLDFVIEEIVVRRYNRLGSEGMSSEAVEGHSITFSNWREDFEPYAEILATYRVDDDPQKGQVIFL